MKVEFVIEAKIDGKGSEEGHAQFLHFLVIGFHCLLEASQLLRPLIPATEFTCIITCIFLAYVFVVLLCLSPFDCHLFIFLLHYYYYFLLCFAGLLTKIKSLFQIAFTFFVCVFLQKRKITSVCRGIICYNNLHLFLHLFLHFFAHNSIMFRPIMLASFFPTFPVNICCRCFGSRSAIPSSTYKCKGGI